MPFKERVTNSAELFVADTGGIPAYGVAKPGADDTKLAKAGAGSDDVIGAIQNAEAAIAGDTVYMNFEPDIPLVVLGGSVDMWDRLTADTNGAAVKASSTNKYFGRAGKAGDAGDVIPYKPERGIA